MATIKFVRDEKGNLIAVNAETGEKIGEMTTMGDNLEEKK